MPLTTPTVSTDAAKLAALRRIKLIAAALLAICVAVFAAAQLLEPRWPGLGFVAAFAEAATIGGIADWYAVVALFSRPLGLPIPHTAIIPANQNRIADNLGRFIEVNFLAAGAGPRKARRSRLRRARRRLADRCRAAPPACRASSCGWCRRRSAPSSNPACAASSTSRMLEQIGKVPLAPLAAELLSALTDDRRHQKLFDELHQGARPTFLNDEQALATMRENIRDELPSLFNLFRADAYLLKKIVASAGSLLDEVRADPDHPMRAEFDRFAQAFIERLRDSKQYASAPSR